MLKRQGILHHKYYIIDGLDGVGKSTQIALLKNYFETKNTPVLTTRAIGGPAGSEIEKIRDFIFSNTFSPEIEEDLFELSSRMNMKWIENTITDHVRDNPKNKEIVVIQDRGPMSHFTYAVVKGMYRDSTYERYKKVLQYARKLSAITVVLVPENIDMIMKRINDRGIFSNFHSTYENVEAQKQVLERIAAELYRNNGRTLSAFSKYHVVVVEEKDQPIDLHMKILNKLQLVL